MKLAFILDPLETLKTEKDTTFLLMQEAQSLGHEVHVLGMEDLILAKEVEVFSQELDIIAQKGRWWKTTTSRQWPITAFDAVLVRKDPPFDSEYLYLCQMLMAAEKKGGRVFNSPEALCLHNEKLAISRFAEFTAPTLVTRKKEWILGFLEKEGDMVLKPLDAMGGKGIFRVRLGDPNTHAIIETLTDEGKKTVMAQKYLPQVAEGDKRILLIDGDPLPYALARIPQPGETRANLARGGIPRVQPLSGRDEDIARAVGAHAKREGLFLVGLDVIGDCLTEVNVTSPTGMREILDQTGYPVGRVFFERLKEKVGG